MPVCDNQEAAGLTHTLKGSRKVNTLLFRKLDHITEDTYEVESCKKTIKLTKLNLPNQIGFFVYRYVKLRMLQFYFDFLDKYLDRSDFQMCEMDTDSAYIAISGESVERLVKPELKISVTGFRVPIRPSIKRMIQMISVHQGFSKLSGRGRY